MDPPVADAVVVKHLDPRSIMHIGHAPSGGEAARYVKKFGEPIEQVARAALVSAVSSLMLKTDASLGGLPIKVFNGFRAALAGFWTTCQPALSTP